MRSMNCDLVSLVKNMLLYLIDRKMSVVNPFQITAVDVKRSLHTVFVEHFGKSDILLYSVVIAEGDRLLFSARKR